MNRFTQPLTEKNCKISKRTGSPICKYEPKENVPIYDCVDKLGELEDIEDGLDIDLKSVKVWTNPETQKVDVISMYDKQHKNEIVIKVKEVNSYRK